MLKKQAFWISCLFALTTCSSPFSTPDSPAVIGLAASSQTESFLQVTTHIRETERPEDPFEYPIEVGEVGPIAPYFAGAPQYPFYCMTIRSGLGQPIVDNQEGLGVPVYAENTNGERLNRIIGYSKDCLVPTKVQYFAIDHQDEIVPVTQNSNHDQFHIHFRVETGVINRYPYTIVMPIQPSEIGDRHAKKLWNKKLIYQLFGGVGIGYRQGKTHHYRIMKKRLTQFKEGYAVISSSVNKTSYTYNILLAEDTGRRLKKQFTSLYGEPIYTIGVGGSGGGLSQYLFGQNAPGLIDGAITQYSYPDMVSQVIYALDCDLLNSYYDFKAPDRKKWQNKPLRIAVEGMNASETIQHPSRWFHPINHFIQGKQPFLPELTTECINGWFGLSSYVNNPRQGFLKPYFSPEIVSQVEWSHWQDLSYVYGKSESGNANAIWDNVGVQYGLEALKKGLLSPQEFLHLNQHIGGWKPQTEMQQEEIAKLPFVKFPIWLSLWSNHNTTAVGSGNSAARTQASLSSIERAYRYGLIFTGHATIPTIDVRHYLEDRLDMHHMLASFEVRKRIMRFDPHYQNHILWVAEQGFNPTDMAFTTLSQWLDGHKPEHAVDTCFEKDGNAYAKGDGVWHGAWNQHASGKCLKKYPQYATPRIQAGAPWLGSLFKCHRMDIESALEQRLYGDIDMRPFTAQLKQVFPDGVCDYSQGDMGWPNDLVDHLVKR
ncbi:DUF6351 family protein [Algicola sagamiensis]|uniref:DUF6351 family protein n=1 Tax=Algicola sagamiensis TaxID=163869 RepID=UPI00035CBB5D|nr:DUF6351 family protein [Algicola sagamiensis]